MLEDKYLIRRIQSEVDHGINSEDGDVTNVRQAMLSRYLGDKYGDEREGFSKVTTREVLQAIEWALPSLLRVFTGGVKPVEFKASGPDDVAQAKHETDVVAHHFSDGSADGSSFLTLYSWLKDILMYPNGYIKVMVDESEIMDQQRFQDVNEAQLEQMEEAAGEDHTETAIDTERGRGPAKLFSGTITTRRIEKRVDVSAVPPDCVIVSHGHNKLDLDSADFVCIREQKSRSTLRKEGYTEEQLEDLAPDDSETWNDEAVTRLFYTDEQPDGDSDAYDTEADEMFWVHEAYMQVDFDEDGINELRRVVMVGCKVLENEPFDYQPVIAATAILMTHKHVGLSYAEIVADLQEIMTVLTRQLLDNIYKQNVQRKYIAEAAMLSDNSTMDALLDGRSEFIQVRGSPHEAILAETVTPIVTEIATVIEQFKEQPQMRTGVAPQLSLDPSVLEKSTMGAFVGALEQASQRLELLARLFAETALRKAFQKVHYCLRTYFTEAQQLEIGGKWISADPSTWKRRSNMNVNVGLGFNNKQAMQMLLTGLLQIQREALPTGLADPAKIFATLEQLIEQMNLGHATTFFNDPKEPGFKAPPPQPDAAMIIAQAQAEALKAEIKRKDDEALFKADLETKKHEEVVRHNREEEQLKANEQNQKLLDHKNTVAKTAAEITSLNSDKNKQAGPAADSSADEFALAGVKTAKSETKSKPKDAAA